MAALVTLDDVEAVWRPLQPEERAQAGRLLDLASSLARSRSSDLDERVGLDETFADVVSLVLAGAIVRVLANPDGVTQRAEGPYSVTFNASSSSGLILTPDEVATLRGRPAPTATVYSIPLS